MFFLSPEINWVFSKISNNARAGQKKNHTFFGNERPKSNARAHLKQRKYIVYELYYYCDKGSWSQITHMRIGTISHTSGLVRYHTQADLFDVTHKRIGTILQTCGLVRYHTHADWYYITHKRVGRISHISGLV